MKKSLYSVIVILLSVFMVNVRADELFKYEFTSNEFIINDNSSNPTSIELPFSLTPSKYTASYNSTMANATNLISYRNGYIGIDITNNKGTTLSYYDAKGNIIKSNFIKDYYIITGSITATILPKRYLFDLTIENNNKLYCIAVSSNQNIPVTLVINENLEIEQKLENRIIISKSLDKFYFIDTTIISDLKNLEQNINKLLYTTDLNLESHTPVNIQKIIEGLNKQDVSSLRDIAELIKDILPNYKWIVDLVADDLIKILTSDDIDSKENMEIINNNPILSLLDNGKNFLDITDKYVAVIDKKTDNIQIIDSNGNMIFNKKLNYDDTLNIQIIHDYIIMIKSDECEYSSIEIYNLNGDLVQKITKNASEDTCLTRMPMSLKETKNGFSSLNILVKTSSNLPRSQARIQDIPREYYYTNEIYSMPQEIKVKPVVGGNITIVSSARFGETVTFTVEKQTGYTLKMVRAFDADGRELEVKNNTFTMPNSEVSIEAEFVEELKENPKTGQISLIGTAIIIIILGLAYKLSYKKMTTLKKL